MKRSTIVLFLLLIGLIPVSGPVFAEEASGTPEKGDAPGVERLLMGGTEIQGTVEKPHVIYVVPWREDGAAEEREIPFERSFKEEILAPVDFDRFQSQWGSAPKSAKGGEKQ